MKKNRLLSLLLAAVMTAAAALTLTSCKESEESADYALKYNVSGTWYAEYDAEGVVGGGQMEYNRLITACTFNTDGTGTWYKLMLTNDSGDPIAIDGGAGHGDFTYSVSADGKITCKLNWNQAPAYYPKTLTLTAGDGSITGTEGTVAYSMQRSPDAITSWIEDWDQQLNGGGNLSPTSFYANTDFTASTWRTEEWIYIYDGVGTSHPTEKGFTIVALPWNTEHSNGTLQTNLPEGFCNDITPENGWELVLNLCGNSIIGGVKNNNFFALYNKYLGILRFFYFMPADFEAGNDHVWQVSMSENLGQHSLYGYGVPSDFTFTNKAFIGQSGVGYMEYVTPWVDYKSSDGLIVPNAGWWAFDVDLSTYRSNANYNGDNIKLQMRSWDITHTSLYSTLTAGIEGTIKANMELYQAAKKSSAGSSAKGVLMGLQAAAQAGSTVTSFCTGNWAAGLTSMGQMFGTGASLAGLGGDGGGAANYKLDGTISLGMSGDMNTNGVISGSKATVGIPSPTISLNDFDPKNSHVGQGVWNLKKAPVVYRTRHVAFDTWTYSYTGKWCCFVSRPYFFDPSSIEVELNPDVFPESQIEWMEVDAICGATADKQCQPPSVTNFSGNVAWRDAYGLVTPGLERYWADLIDKSSLIVVENRKNSIWDFLYNMNDKHGMDALHTVFKFKEDITIADTKIQGRGKNGFAIEPQITGAFNFKGSELYIPYFFLEVNVKVKVKMKNMQNPIVLSRNYLPDIVDYGDGSEFDKSRKHSRPYQSKMSGHTDLYDYQMKRIDDIIDVLELYPVNVNLSTLTSGYMVKNGQTLTGTLESKVKISITDGATVTLDGVTINGTNDYDCKWAGITCEGNATIILKGTNTVRGFYSNYPGVHVLKDKTLTIKGNGTLTVSSNGYGAGIGGGFNYAGGNIVIEGGIINATGGNSAGIGCGYNSSCGNITISGGTINATGGVSAAGIGSSNYGSCGNITITNGVTSVTATKGKYAPYSIGEGEDGTCGTVTIGGKVTGNIKTSPYTYKP